MSIDQKYEIQVLSDKIGHFIRIRSLNKAKHFAVYRTYTKRFPDGKEINEKINENIKDILIKSIKKKGITEGFILKFDEGISTFLWFLNCEFFILASISPIGSVKLI